MTLVWVGDLNTCLIYLYIITASQIPIMSIFPPGPRPELLSVLNTCLCDLCCLILNTPSNANM